MNQPTMQCRPVPGTAHRLCLRQDMQHGDRWFTRSKGGGALPLSGLSIAPEGGIIGDFSVSPDARLLAVTVAEEGHPTLLFFHLPQALRGKADSSGLPAIPVYPGSLSINEWEDAHTLRIESDQDLSVSLHGGETGDVMAFRVHLPDGTIRRADSGSADR